MRGRIRFETAVILGLVALCAALLFAVVLERGHGGTPKLGTVVAVDWSTPEPGVDRTSAVAGPEGERALQVRIGTGRTFFSVLQARFAHPQDWADRSLVLLNFEAGGADGDWQVIFTFDAGGASFALYTVPDTPKGWRQVGFSTAAPTATQGTIDWSHVTGIELTRVKTAKPETIAVGELRLAEPFAHASP